MRRKKKYCWFYFSDQEPDLSQMMSNSGNEEINMTQVIQTKKLMPCFHIASTLGKEFGKWLIGSGGGYKTTTSSTNYPKEF